MPQSHTIEQNITSNFQTEFYYSTKFDRDIRWRLYSRCFLILPEKTAASAESCVRIFTPPVYVCTCYRISYIKDRDSPRARHLESIEKLHLRRPAASPQNPLSGEPRECFIWRCQQPGDINRTALACWNYVGGRGWREIRLPWNFRRTRHCGERAGWKET